jgi:hypothetical protein
MNITTADIPSTPDSRARRLVLATLASSLTGWGLTACGGGGGGGGGGSEGGGNGSGSGGSPAIGASATPDGVTAPAFAPSPAKSAKRGIAYDLATVEDLSALAPGVSWWYDWGLRPNASAPADYRTRHGVDFQPMLWNGNFDAAEVAAFLQSQPGIRHLLLLNEPNLTDQANLTPSQAAALWPRYEAVAVATGVQLVGPAMTWGTMNGYADPVVWLDAFYASYRAANGNRDPQIDYLSFHWYDYGLGGQLDRLTKYGKPFWVTEFANWHSSADGAQIDTVAKQKAQMTNMVATCESRADVFRYAWFTGRWSNDVHHTSLLGANGVLTELGQHYLALPFN